MTMIDNTMITKLQSIYESLSITTESDCSVARELLVAVEARKKKIKEAFDSLVEAAHQQHKAAVAKRKSFLEPVEQIEVGIKRKLAAYIEAKRMEEQAKIAEQSRLLAEQAAKEAEERIEEAKAEGSAEAIIEAVQQNEEAEKQTELVVKTIAQQAPVKMQGIKTMTVYDFEIIDEALLPREYLIPDEVKIRKIVKALKDEAKKHIPGIKVITKTSCSVK